MENAKVINFTILNLQIDTIAHPWYDSHSICISACGVWRASVRVQVFRREFHTHIHLDYVRIKFLSCIKKNKIKNLQIDVARMRWIYLKKHIKQMFKYSFFM